MCGFLPVWKTILRTCWVTLVATAALPVWAQDADWLQRSVSEIPSDSTGMPAGAFHTSASDISRLATRLGEQEQALSQTKILIEQQQSLLEQQASELQQLRQSLHDTKLTTENALRNVGHNFFLDAEQSAASDETIYKLQQHDEFFMKFQHLDNFFSKVDFSGHVRVRHETSWHRIDRPARNRGRLRARLQMRYNLNEEIEAGLRLTTGDRKLVLEPGDRTGSVLSYQDTGDVFDKFAFNLDRIYITYKPDWAPNAWITGGKFKHPVKLNPIYAGPVGSLGFDEAVHPEGAAGGYAWEDTLGFDALKFVLGETVLLELGNQDEASMFFTQLWAEKQVSDRWKAEAGVTWYDWHNVNPDGNTTVTLTNFGNATTSVAAPAGTLGAQIGIDGAGNPIFDGVGRSTFDSKFSIVNPMAVLTYDDGDYDSGLQPIQFVYEAFQNTRAVNNNRDFGYSIGAVYGPAVTRSGRKQGDWKFWYTWNDVQQESVFTPVAQDDFQQATNFRGHFIGLDYFPWDQFEVRIWLLSDEPIEGPQKEQWRTRADITVYF